MIETSVIASEPMLYITTRTSDRASSIASIIKQSVDHVRGFMEENGIQAAGSPLAVFSDWTGRLVTIEAGYPVKEDSLSLASGRIQAGWTPSGPAVRCVVDHRSTEQSRRHAAFVDEVRAAGLRTTGTSWEVYDIEGAATDIYVQLLASLSLVASN
jgi:hypothetical protein